MHTLKHYNPYYKDPQDGTPNFGNPQIAGHQPALTPPPGLLNYQLPRNCVWRKFMFSWLLHGPSQRLFQNNVRCGVTIFHNQESPMISKEPSLNPKPISPHRNPGPNSPRACRGPSQQARECSLSGWFGLPSSLAEARTTWLTGLKSYYY